MVKPVPEIVIGIDPGYDRFGWAVFSQLNGQQLLLDCGCIVTNRKAPRLERYLQILDELSGILEKYSPMTAAMEQLFFSRNVSTALPVAEIRGLAMALFLQRHMAVRQFNPGTVKSSVTGNGKADKTAMRKMVLLQLGPVSPQLHQKVSDELDDTIDAVGVAMTAIRTPNLEGLH
ncbi:crossover junction endodeoxyribonuclease RuvC [Patescibacteria group bacterium]|nr:crossover junction endodeoxyribonuclease RuvC [Patescibacteria group bacterium]